MNHSTRLAARLGASPAVRRGARCAGMHTALPPVHNEPVLEYAKGSAERAKLQAALDELRASLPHKVPCVVNGEEHWLTGGSARRARRQPVPAAHATAACEYAEADARLVRTAADGAIEAARSWAALPFWDRAAVFLRAAALLSSDEWRFRVLAATIVGQGKSVMQAEIDAAAELADFWRFNVSFAAEIHGMQPRSDAARDVANAVDHGPLSSRGFVAAMSPFNFTAIGGNLACAPALMGNAVLWKPSAGAVLSNYTVHRVLTAAGLPPGVVQFLPADGPAFAEAVLDDPRLSGLHYTGSTAVFEALWRGVGERIARYDGYPRLVGETGGKNFHLVHPSCSSREAVRHAAVQTLRGAFEYQGQKCSAASRLFVPASVWPSLRADLLAFGEEILSEHREAACGRRAPEMALCGAVISAEAYARVRGYVERARKAGAEVLLGGGGDDALGWFVEPTILLVDDTAAEVMAEEIFGPVLAVHVYADAKYDDVLAHLADGGRYGLTGAVFAEDRGAIARARGRLRDAAGNFYVNDKCTGAVVGQQPFGGARKSGTNDKAGSLLNLLRWSSARTTKEYYGPPLRTWSYPSLAL